MSLDERLINQLKSLSKQDKLIAMQVLFTTEQTAKRKHKITELAGLGKEIWTDLDAQEYVDKERSDWE